MNSSPLKLHAQDSYIYLAAPYWHADPKIRDHRARLIGVAAGNLIYNQHPTYSPISMGVAIQCSFNEHYRHIFDRVETWTPMEEAMIKNCAVLIVLTLDGWKESKGIKREIACAEKNNRPIKYCSMEEILSLGDIHEKV